MLVQYQSPSFLVVHVNNPGVTGKRFYSYLSCEIGSQHWVNIFTIILSSSWQANLRIFSRSFLSCIILTWIILSNLVNLSVVNSQCLHVFWIPLIWAWSVFYHFILQCDCLLKCFKELRGSWNLFLSINYFISLKWIQWSLTVRSIIEMGLLISVVFLLFALLFLSFRSLFRFSYLFTMLGQIWNFLVLFCSWFPVMKFIAFCASVIQCVTLYSP